MCIYNAQTCTQTETLPGNYQEEVKLTVGKITKL